MNRTILSTVFICLFTLTNLISQICPDCDNNPEKLIYPRYWEDPTGAVYHVESIENPDKLGIWILYEDFGNGQIRVLHTNHVRCLDNQDGTPVDGRSRDELASNEIQVFPNPTSEYLMIIHAFSKCNITISDMSGKIIFNVTNLDKKNYNINTSEFTPGIYTLNIVAEHKQFNKRIVIN